MGLRNTGLGGEMLSLALLNLRWIWDMWLDGSRKNKCLVLLRLYSGPHSVSFNPHNNPIIMPPFYRWENWNIVKLNNLPTITWLWKARLLDTKLSRPSLHLDMWVWSSGEVWARHTDWACRRHLTPWEEARSHREHTPGARKPRKNHGNTISSKQESAKDVQKKLQEVSKRNKPRWLPRRPGKELGI